MNLKYILGSILTIPLLPLMYYHGKRIRAQVPILPEATGTSGHCGPISKNAVSMLVLGESTMASVGVQTHQEGFAGCLAASLATQLQMLVKWKVYAKSGYNASQIKNKILPLITEESPDLIVLGIGGNDAFELRHPRKWRKHVKGVISDLKLRFGNVPIVFANMPPIKEFPAFTKLIRFTIGNLVEILGEELISVVSQFENVFYSSNVVVLEEWIERLSLNRASAVFFSDGVHPSQLTYQIWANDLSDFLVQHTNFRKFIEDTLH